MTGADLVDGIAGRLRGASASGAPIDPVAPLLAGEADPLGAAYAVQTRVLADTGHRIVGRKIGLTSSAVQKQLGVDTPDFGALTDRMAYADGGEVPAGAVLQPRAEAELALVLERPIQHAWATMADVISATAYALPAIEVCGSRIAGWRIGLLDTVADNASAGAFVLGGTPRRLTGIDPRAIRMRMTCGGEAVSEGTGAACLGNPLAAATWLAREMARRGSPLQAGDIILTGALGPMVACNPGDVFEAELSGVGPVGFRLGVADA